MRTLTLMRHAKSSWDDAAIADHERPLNERGKKAAKTMAKRLKHSGYAPDLVIVSSAVRAQQTAKALQTAYDDALKLRTEPTLYEAPEDAYAEVIRHVDDGVKDLLIIGHNPTIEWIAAQLCSTPHRMPTAAYVRVEIPCHWRDFRFETFKELDYDYPKSGR